MVLLRFSILFILTVAAGYLFLHFCSRLFGVDMTAMFCSNIRQRQDIGWTLFWCFFFFVGFVPFYGLAQKPVAITAMHFSHEGGLLGYASDFDHAMLYDPAQKAYRSHRIYPPPPAASSFDEAFEPVVFYRVFGTGLYQNIEWEGYCGGVFRLFLSGFVFTMLGLFSYRLAEAHLVKQRGPRLSVQVVFENCKAWTGYSLPVVLTAIVFVLAVTTIVSGYLVNRLRNDYDERFADSRRDLTTRLMASVAPGRTIKGRVIKRVRDVRSERSQSRSLRYRDYPDRTSSTLISTYTIEFNDLVDNVPVYLSYALIGSPDKNPGIKLLDELFPPEGAPGYDFLETLARDPRELPFVVTDDYRVSLSPEAPGST